jgi:hypothetical protein
MAYAYRKTTKGQVEIETRANRLAPRLRTSLILVDGKRGDAELRQLITTGADEVLATLAEQGFIEMVVVTPPARVTSGASASAEAAARRFTELRLQAVRFLNDQMGPSAESLAIDMEQSNSFDELRPHLETAERFLRAGRGASAAEEFFLQREEPPPP